ncbi:reverse transcriptase domain-containing protein [Tanacetum coccineum]
MILQTNTKTLEDLCSQTLETASQAIHDAVTTHQVTASQHFMTASVRTDSNADLEDYTYDGVLENQLLSISLLICLGKRDCVERIIRKLDQFTHIRFHSLTKEEGWIRIEEYVQYQDDLWDDVTTTPHHEGTTNVQGKGTMAPNGLSEASLRTSSPTSCSKRTINKSKTSKPEAPTFAITTRSGISTQDPPFPALPRPETDNLIEKERSEDAEPSITQEPAPRPSILYQPSKTSNLPFPSRLKKQKNDDEDERLLSIFKQIYINLPFLEAMIHMPKGAKVLKDLLSHKEKLKKTASSVKLSEECSDIIQRSLPQKEGDTGSFILPCLIGPLAVKNALADLGASINLIPHSLFRRLGIFELKSTKISIHLADRSIKYPIGVCENLLVKVGKFIFPVNFIILEMEKDELVPIILGRPFLATARAAFDVHEGKLSLRVESETITFNIRKTMKSKYSRDDYLYCADHTAKTESVEPLEWRALENRLRPSNVEPPKLELKDIPEYRETKNRQTFQAHTLRQQNNKRSTRNYTTTEKELLAVVFAFDKFPQYLVLSKTIVFTDHSTLRYLFTKQDVKPCLIRWILLLQEFNIEFRDKKGAENLAADHRSRLENPDLGKLTRAEIRDLFPEERLMEISDENNEPWYADYAN